MWYINYLVSTEFSRWSELNLRKIIDNIFLHIKGIFVNNIKKCLGNDDKSLHSWHNIYFKSLLSKIFWSTIRLQLLFEPSKFTYIQIYTLLWMKSCCMWLKYWVFSLMWLLTLRKLFNHKLPFFFFTIQNAISWVT